MTITPKTLFTVVFIIIAFFLALFGVYLAFPSDNPRTVPMSNGSI